jgi:hypothetical protein
MTPSAIVTMALRILPEAGREIFLRTALPSLVAFAGIMFLFRVGIPLLFSTRDGDRLQTQIEDFIGALALSSLVALPLVLLGFTVATATTVHVTARYLTGEPGAADEATPRSVLSLFWGLLIAAFRAFAVMLLLGGMTAASAIISDRAPQQSVWATLAAVGTTICLLVALPLCLVVMNSFALVAPVLVLEKVDARTARIRSRFLMRRQPGIAGGSEGFWSIVTLAVLLAIIALVGVASLLSITSGLETLGWAIGPLPGYVLLQAAIADLPAYLAVWGIGTFLAVGLTVLYYERRVRVEGHDIEVLGRQAERG